MSKAARAFQMPAEDADEAVPPPPAQKAAAAPEPAPEAPVAPTGSRPSYREGRRNLSVWIDQKAFNAFKAMVAEDGGTVQDYVIDLINREFARRGRPQIAK